MKVLLTGRNFAEIRPMLAAAGLTEVDQNPEVIVTYGGDGSLLGAERTYPGIPKLPLRDGGCWRLCDEHSIEKQLQNFIEGKTAKDGLKKLEVLAKDQHRLAVNDIYIHNEDPASALRYQVWIDGKLYAEEIAGDAVGLSSIHGSSAYYRSITHSVFRVGLGLAFSNSMELVNHLVIAETSEVRIRIIRGPGMIIADNDPERISLERGEDAVFRQSNEIAYFYGIDNFMCPKCRYLRHLDQYPYAKLQLRGQ